MSTPMKAPSGETASKPSEHDAMLRRILELVEQHRTRGRLELVVAIVLSLATLASTWCGYQSGKWGGLQGSKQAAADTAERKAAECTIVALQRRTQDGLVLLEYYRAIRAGDRSAEQTIRAHMGTVLGNAVQAAIDDGILTNPDVVGPLQRAEYRLAEEVEATAMRGDAHRLKSEAAAAGQAASRYVLLTIMFASVLFFGGISGTFADRRIRVVLASVAVMLFLATSAMLLGLPVMGA